MSWEHLFDTVEEKQTAEFGPIAAGKYTAFIYEAKLMENRETPQVSITWKIVDEDSKFKNRFVFANYNMNEKGIPFFKSDLTKLDVTEVTSSNLTTKLAELVGREALVTVKPREHNGKTYYSVFVDKHLTKDAAAKAYGTTANSEALPF